ncbi:MAG: hypothetical protein LBG27_04000 [Spirochaetaceae bacterium]|jgi:hypothetical protein|nr:hypothetical protein [Spirochaetaceae bacterium]
MKFSEYQRRIRPELAERISRFQFEEVAGRDPDTADTAAEEACRHFGHGEYDREKEMWALNEQLALWEDSLIRLGFCLLQVKEHETDETYLATWTLPH